MYICQTSTYSVVVNSKTRLKVINLGKVTASRIVAKMTLKMTQVLLNNQNIRNMLYWKEEYTKLC